METPVADKLSNEPTSGMTISFQGANQRSQTAAIANTTLKQSRVTDIVSFTGDHSTMIVDVGDFVKLTNAEKGYDEKLFRVVRTVEQNIMGALTVKFTLAEYSDAPFEDIIYLDTTDEPFATGVGTLENYNDITDEPRTKRWRVVVEQRNVFYIDEDEAETAEEARRIAAEDRIWDEDQRGEDTYDVEITVEEEENGCV